MWRYSKIRSTFVIETTSNDLPCQLNQRLPFYLQISTIKTTEPCQFTLANIKCILLHGTSSASKIAHSLPVFGKTLRVCNSGCFAEIFSFLIIHSWNDCDSAVLCFHFIAVISSGAHLILAYTPYSTVNIVMKKCTNNVKTTMFLFVFLFNYLPSAQESDTVIYLSKLPISFVLIPRSKK